MNVLFIYSRQDAQSPKKPLQTEEQMHFGISYISSFLRQHGHNTKLLVASREIQKEQIDPYLNGFRPTLVCFTAVFTEYAFIVSIANYVKAKYPHIYLIAGGPHVTLNPEDCLADPFDALCISEGELATLELVEQLERNHTPSGIAGLWIKHGPGVERNPARPFLPDLDSLPFPDREMWREWITTPTERCSVLLSRGCPFKCTYCSNHALSKVTSGPYVRFRSPENIVAEIESIIARSPTQKEIYLEVETIYANKEWALELCSKLERLNARLSQPLSFGTNIRITPQADLEKLFVALQKSNFRFINIGLESGSERVRRRILKRIYSNEDVVRTVKLARKYGLQVCFFNLIGIPGETLIDFRETIEINRRCVPDWHFLSIFYPYPGTDLYSVCKERGLIKEPLDTDMERTKALLDLPEFSRKQIQRHFTWFDYHVYKGRKPLHKILARVLVSKMRSSYRWNRFYRTATNYPVVGHLRQLLRRY